MKKFSILGVNISAVNLESASAAIDAWIRNHEKRYVCVAPVSTILSCQDDTDYKDVINNADMVTPDGMPVVWLGRRQGFHEVSRTYGPDLMQRVCFEGQKKGYRHYFYGAAPKTLEKLINRLKEGYPQIQIAGYYAPPFRPLSASENQDVIEKINAAQADILWVGLGSPKQDFWMKQNRDKLHVPVAIGVGAAFDFLAGTKKQAPRWMQRSGLEWLFRFLSEPRRLWRRYLIGNPRFIFLLMKEYVTTRKTG